MLLASFAFDAQAEIPVREGCSENDSVVASVQSSDPLIVHHGVSGEAQPCYAVSVPRVAGELRGYVLGTSLPAIQEFERRRALEARIPLTAPPPVSKPKVDLGDLGPLAGRQFEPWSGIDWNGRPIEIRPGTAKVTLVTFWKPLSRAARNHVQEIEYVRQKFNQPDLKAIGFIEAASIASTKYYTEDMSVYFSQTLDHTGIASRFGVDSAKGTTLVLDESGKVFASSSDPKQIRTIVTTLLSSN
jgi:hypothetical protein